MCKTKITLSCLLLFYTTVCSGFLQMSRDFEKMIGLGPSCTGCSNRYCNDDRSIIFGYCCGCARLRDVLPVGCSNSIVCPLNTHKLCIDFEYMMHCCC
ncbi:uncharacterized protein LOC132706090 [Cylas formicarius]|uniref:uncharacterized protein LOC132706090 n=1 Tax=Cylas formicarius TaxID=197179 RepID=UPI002958A70F|nr:uncharacterized protein LOC132706090 [Cylas formicarius]